MCPDFPSDWKFFPPLQSCVDPGDDNGLIRAFSSEVDTGSREENVSKKESRASVLIQSEPIML
jgi:hypothetical protein